MGKQKLQGGFNLKSQFLNSFIRAVSTALILMPLMG